jgi:hypothetical protein
MTPTPTPRTDALLREILERFGVINGEFAPEDWVKLSMKLERENSTLQSRVKELEATVAEMRAALETCESHRGQWEHSQHFDDSKVEHALSITCGQGWKSPEEVKQLTDALRYYAAGSFGPTLAKRALAAAGIEVGK